VMFIKDSTGMVSVIETGNITYDWNNNPKQIYFTNGSVTKYVYSASGKKLRAVHYTAKPNITRAWGVKPAELTSSQILQADSTDYLLGGSLTLKNGKVDKYLFEGGYAQATAASSTTDSFAFYYYNQDHLGNVREVVDASGNVKQVTNYYPFGAPYADASASMNPDFQPYKYSGKELDRMHGLNTYDHGARQYDPILLRWDRMDPLCEKFYPFSPYNYCGNSPIKHIDPDGKDIIPILFRKVNSKGEAVGKRYRSSLQVKNAMTLFGKTRYGKQIIGSFLPKGKYQYGVKGTGEFSNFILKIKQFNTGENHFFTGESPGAVKYGSFGINEENGTLVFSLTIDVDNNKSYPDLMDTIVHELCLHGHNIKNIIEAYKAGGLKAVEKLKSKGPSEESSHRALEKKDVTVPGVGLYYETKNAIVESNRELMRS
ncbi:RHS repeat domain-containing protein, partial [Prevotella sp. P6B4]|uniref:RHS repeat domain-containing protein n=1 Tax=Prevotella sp. P6B4 TaxID=1410614 RepID=UPI00350E50BD